jgi:hypothetical protein
MGHRALAFVFVAFALCAASPAGAQSGKAPKTPWGKPDLNGIWDFRTITPLERPANLADKEFLTPAEAAKLEQETIERNAEIDSRPSERTTAGGNVDRRQDGSPGFYNNFWLDGGTKPVGSLRTSLIVDPPNGKVPPLTPAAQKRAEERRAYLKEHPADGRRTAVSDRCILVQRRSAAHPRRLQPEHAGRSNQRSRGDGHRDGPHGAHRPARWTPSAERRHA